MKAIKRVRIHHAQKRPKSQVKTGSAHSVKLRKRVASQPATVIVIRRPNGTFFPRVKFESELYSKVETVMRARNLTLSEFFTLAVQNHIAEVESTLEGGRS